MSDDSTDSSDEDNYPILTEYPLLTPPFTNICNLTCDPQLPSIHSLNDDCLENILSYFDFVELTKVSFICRRWYNLCLLKLHATTDLHMTPTFSIFRLNRNIEAMDFISILLKTNNNLISLDVSQSTLFIRTNTPKVISDLCPKLESLNLSKFHITRKVSLRLSQYLPTKLTCLVLSGCCSLKEKYLNNILMACKNLEHLDLSYNQRINGQCIVKRLQNNKMRYFNLTECFNLRPSVVQFIFEQYAETLEYLNLTMCKPDIVTFSKTNLKPLTALTSFIYKGMEDTPLIGIIETVYATHTDRLLSYMPNLSLLNVNSNASLLGDCRLLSRLPHYCPMLSTLDISFCFIVNAQYLEFVGNLSNLKHLGISGLDSNFEYCEFGRDTLSKLHELTSLTLKACYLTDSVIFSIIQEHPKLQKLDIRSSTLFHSFGEFIKQALSLERTTKLVVYAQDTLLDAVFVEKTPDFMTVYYSIQPYDEFQEKVENLEDAFVENFGGLDLLDGEMVGEGDYGGDYFENGEFYDEDYLNEMGIDVAGWNYSEEDGEDDDYGEEEGGQFIVEIG